MRDSVQLGVLFVVVALSVTVSLTIIWVSAIDHGNRKAICTGRALLERNKDKPDFDTMDRARLKLARQQAELCK